MTLRLALLGDSIAWGRGAAREQDPLAGRLSRRRPSTAKG